MNHFSNLVFFENRCGQKAKKSAADLFFIASYCYGRKKTRDKQNVKAKFSVEYNGSMSRYSWKSDCVMNISYETHSFLCLIPHTHIVQSIFARQSTEMYELLLFNSKNEGSRVCLFLYCLLSFAFGLRPTLNSLSFIIVI